MGAHGASDFEKDHGLVHEAVVTGRKVGADEKFFSEILAVLNGLAGVVVILY